MNRVRLLAGVMVVAGALAAEAVIASPAEAATGNVILNQDHSQTTINAGQQGAVCHVLGGTDQLSTFVSDGAGPQAFSIYTSSNCSTNNGGLRRDYGSGAPYGTSGPLDGNFYKNVHSFVFLFTYV